jgi:hypothetical protein
MPRPRGARLIEGFSPKLGRRLQFFDHATFGVWIGLEATPDVITFCERPIHGTVLETRCRSCGNATRYHLNAKLIDAPFGCAQCGSRHSRGPTCICKRSPLLQQDRTAITRTFLG